MAEFPEELADREIDGQRKSIDTDTCKAIKETNNTVWQSPLRILPLQMGAGFDEPMLEAWNALAE
jgi:hypothetical protein